MAGNIKFSLLGFHLTCRERYEELTIQCQRMYSSVGTGSLAYVIGSKIMDVNAYSKDDMNREAKSEEKKDFRDSSNKFDDYYNRNNKCTDTTYTQRESSSDSYSDDVPGPEKLNSGSLIPRGQAHESQFFVESALPVTNLFEKSEESDEANESQDDGRSTKWKFRVSYERTRSFHFDNSNELNILSNGSRSETLRHSISSEIKVADGSCDGPQEQVLQQDFPMYRNNILNKLRRCDVAERTELYSSHHLGGESSEDKVLEWFWTLHRIGNGKIYGLVLDFEDKLSARISPCPLLGGGTDMICLLSSSPPGPCFVRDSC